MPCYSPLTGYRSRKVNPSGKRSIVFNIRDGYKDLKIKLPCGQCVGCRLEHSRQNAVRCVHEAKLYDRNCFITLTYNDDNLPPYGSIEPAHPVQFMKDLRAEFGPGIRSFGCAEYGDTYRRPHYHICLFNHDFEDKKFVESTPRGDRLYQSDVLDEIWGQGKCIIGDLTFESAAYVARYVTKKITGRAAEDHYSVLNEYGEYIQLVPERPVCVSRRPGIGKPYLDKYGRDVLNNDFVIVRGRKMRPPKYYDRRFEIDCGDEFDVVKKLRVFNAKECGCGFRDCSHVNQDDTPERLAVRETVQILKINQLKRSID